MRRKLEQYQEARSLRSQGKSIRTISKILQVSSSSASIWCKDIILTDKQRTTLFKNRKINNSELLLNLSKVRSKAKVEKDQALYSKAQSDIKELTRNEIFLVGLALYWAEGFKSITEQRVGFCNSDPRMVKFIMNWFRESLKIQDQDFTLRVEFNISHITKQKELEDYWSNLTKIPLSQFNKPYIQQVNKIKSYSNQTQYHGLLRIRIRKSSQLLIKLRGWIEGLNTLP